VGFGGKKPEKTERKKILTGLRLPPAASLKGVASTGKWAHGIARSCAVTEVGPVRRAAYIDATGRDLLEHVGEQLRVLVAAKRVARVPACGVGDGGPGPGGTSPR